MAYKITTKGNNVSITYTATATCPDTTGPLFLAVLVLLWIGGPVLIGLFT